MAAKQGAPRRRPARASRCSCSAATGRLPSFGPTGAFGSERLSLARKWLRPGLDDNDSLTRRPSRTEALLAAIPNAPIEIRGVVRNSQHFRPWLDRGRREQARIEARAAFETDLECGLATLDIVTCPLPQYQRQGAMHLAFGERTLLADDMGLGKTIQAIAAAELLARIKGLHRTLIICPASLKAVWEEQIAVQRPRQ